MGEPPKYHKVDGFKGLNNRIDPVRLGLEWQFQADNVLCDDANYLVRRPGISAFSDTYVDVYGSRAGRLLAIDSSNNLVELGENGEVVTLFSGVTGAPFQWAELGYAIFLMSPTAKWVVYPHRVIEWGSLCPVQADADYPIGDPISYPPPTGSVICARNSQIAVACWEPERDRSVVYYSRPDFPHEFRLDRDFQIFPGQVTLMAYVAQGMVIGTDRAIYVDGIDSPLIRVADYGVPIGGMVYDDRSIAWFWSQRGLCKAIPFENLTDKVLSVTAATIVTAGLLPWQGSAYAVVYPLTDYEMRTVSRPLDPISITVSHEQGIT